MKENSNMVNLNNFSKYRSQLMGIAAILILLCHSWYCIEFPVSIKYFIVICNIGVDIFLLLSGIGMYFSLDKRESSLNNWYSHRFRRIGIPFLLIIGVEYLFALSVGEINIPRYLLAMTTLGYWFYHDGAWFVSLLVLLYVLSPFLYFLRNHKYGALFLLLILIFSVIIGSLDVTKDNNNFLYNFTFAVQRCPSFIMGFVIAPWVKEERNLNLFYLLLIGVLLKLFLSRFFGVYGSAAFFTLVIPLCALFCYLCELISKIEYTLLGVYFRTGLSYMGKISLESYLTNSLLLRVALIFVIPCNGYIVYAIIIILGIIMSNYIHNLSTLLLDKLNLKK